MSDRVVITGLGVVSAVGATRETFFDALASGATGIRPHARAADGVPLSATIDDFGARRVLDPRSLPRLSQLALVAAKEALAQGMPQPAYEAERTGIVLGTGLGSLRETIDFIGGYLQDGPEAASPLLFPSSVMNASAGQMAIELGLRGPNTTVNHREGSGIDGLTIAADLLRLGRADAFLVGGVDEVCSASLRGYRRLAALTDGALRPYALGRDGTVPGEGAAVMLVEREEGARRRGARILARLAGFAAGGEDRPRIGWGGACEGAAATIAAALDDAGLSPDAVDYVAGGGCGLPVDALEARAVWRVFERAVPHGSILGQTGVFLAAGALRLASAIYALERQALPGTVGAGAPDPEAPVPGLVREPRPAAPSTVLVPSLAQGGANAAIVLARADA